MKKLLIIFSLIIIGCGQPVKTSHIIEEDYGRIDSITQDSIMELADNIILHVHNQKLNKDSMSIEIENQKHEIEEQNIHDKLTEGQIRFLKAEEEELHYQIVTQQVYIEELKAPKDTIIYKIVYKDTIVSNHIYVNDTVHIQIEIIDTIKIKKKLRRNI